MAYNDIIIVLYYYVYVLYAYVLYVCIYVCIVYGARDL